MVGRKKGMHFREDFAHHAEEITFPYRALVTFFFFFLPESYFRLLPVVMEKQSGQDRPSLSWFEHFAPTFDKLKAIYETFSFYLVIFNVVTFI